MRRALYILAIFALSAASVAAQSSYQVDNFDFPNAVRIQTPKVEPAKPSRQPKRLVQFTSMPLNPSLGGFTTGNSEVDNFIVESGKRNSVDPLLLYSIMHQESSFKPRALSYKGARGLMQLMPFTASRFGVTNIWDPKQNIEGGARYMRFLLKLFKGDVRLALAGYNAGEGAVMKYDYQGPALQRNARICAPHRQSLQHDSRPAGCCTGYRFTCRAKRSNPTKRLRAQRLHDATSGRPPPTRQPISSNHR